MRSWLSILIIFSCVLIWHQVVGQSTFGHEWIDSSKALAKVIVHEEGIYRVQFSDLIDAGIPVDVINGDQITLHSYGEEEAVRVSTAGPMGPEDFIEWYGTANDGSVDALLYNVPEKEQLNPKVSLYSSGRPYFISWADSRAIQREELSGGDVNNLPLTELYYMHHEELVYDAFHYKPTHDGRNFIRYSSMDIGEGYGSKLQGATTIEMEVSELSSFGVDPSIHIRFATNSLSRNWQLRVNKRAISNISTGGYSVQDIRASFPLEALHEGENVIELTPLGNNNEKQSIAFVNLIYPRKYVMDSDDFIRFHQQGSIIGREIVIPEYEGDLPIAYNLDAEYFLRPTKKENVLKMNIPAAFVEEEWVIFDESRDVSYITDVESVELTTYQVSGDYVILSTDELIESGAVAEYASFRASEEGGGFDVDVISVDDLYDRYSYGIEGHAIAVKRFVDELRQNGQLPAYFFLLGKGQEYPEIRNKVPSNLLPTFGIPGSDNVLLAPFGMRYPDIPVGRLAAQTPEQIRDYLAKIKEHELSPEGKQTIEDQAWKKRILHLSGGSADIQDAIYRFLNDMGVVIRSNTFGANVKTFRKRSADPLASSSSQEIMEEINQGAYLLTFFGHSAVGTFDFSLEDPSVYENKGRNPIVLSLGCHSGNIHTSSPGISEEFVLEPENGAIAFIASAGTAYAEPQYLSGLYFYDLIGEEMYGQPLGDIVLEAIRRRQGSESIAVQTLLEQLTLHGDPAFHHPTFEGPDYVIDESSVELQPTIISSSTTRITIDFDVVNLGAMIDDLIDIEVIHLLPDGTPEDTILTTISAPGYRNHLSIELFNPGEIAIGSNRLLINIDPQGKIEEKPNDAAKSNNQLVMDDGELGVPFFVFDNSAKPIYPPPFGIVGDRDVQITAALSNGLEANGRFVLQIDSTEHFDSPLLLEETITATSNLISWEPSVEWKEETVYYWRIAPVADRDLRKSSAWRNSSFVYLEGASSGWNQSHYFQHKKNEFTSIELEEGSRQLTFDKRVWDIRIKNEIFQPQDFWVFVNNTPWASLNPRTVAPALSVFIWDPKSVLFSNESGEDFGSIPFSKDVFLYKMDSEEDRENVISLLEAAPEGSRVFFHTVLGDSDSDLHVDEWNEVGPSGKSLIEVLEGYGATRARTLLERGTVPYTFVFDKGGDGIVEDIANNIEEVIDLSARATTIWDQGTIASVQVGPALKWNKLRWSEDKSEEDNTRISIYGITNDGKKESLQEVIEEYEVDLSEISAARYPLLRLVYHSEDETDKSSAQLDYWRVLYDVLPDPALYTVEETDNIDTLRAGETYELAYQVKNLSPADMTSMPVTYTLLDTHGGFVSTTKTRIEKLAGRETNGIIQDIQTDGLEGLYEILVEINSGGQVPEQTDCNNFGHRLIYVIPDRRTPFLDVTFDGNHIEDGDIVAADAVISVSLEDKDSYVLLDDPTDFDITLYYPEALRWKVDTSSFAAEFIPATDLEDNRATMLLTPDLSWEGTYRLEVTARDKAGNTSGNQAYVVSFRVGGIDEDAVVLQVGPNPTTDYVDFQYYLKYERLPAVFDLYIYSTDGRVVGHADSEDFGGLRPGLNTYRWNAKASKGEILPAGLYFYEILNSFDSRDEKVKGSILVIR